MRYFFFELEDDCPLDLLLFVEQLILKFCVPSANWNERRFVILGNISKRKKLIIFISYLYLFGTVYLIFFKIL